MQETAVLDPPGAPSQGRSVLAGSPLHDPIVRALYDDSSRGVILTGADGRVQHCNAAFARMLGYDAAELPGRRFNEFTHPDDRQLGLEALREMVAGTRERVLLEKRYLHRDGGEVWVSLDIKRVHDERGETIVFVTTVEDISLRKQVEQERVQERERIIAAQREALRRLSTPIITIADGVVAVPLIGAVDGERAQLILETLLGSVAALRARVVLLDITGVASVDADTAALFVRATRAVQLLGAEVVLTGVGAEVARQIVSLDLDLHGMRTLGSFQQGVAAALGGRLGRGK